MSFKKAALRSVVIIGIILLSVLIGITVQSIAKKSDMKKNPLQYVEFVDTYSKEYGVPDYIVYAVMKNQSGFDSSILYDDGSIGLMKVSPETLEKYKGTLNDNYDTGMLYDPETNIKYGTYYLSRLYMNLYSWKSVFAALNIGEDTVKEWLSDTEYAEISEKTNPKLKEIPDKATQKFVTQYEKTADKYKSLYFSE